MKLRLVSKIAGFEPFFAGPLADLKQKIRDKYKDEGTLAENLIDGAANLSKEVSGPDKAEKYTAWILKLILKGGVGIADKVSGEKEKAKLEDADGVKPHLKIYNLLLQNPPTNDFTKDIMKLNSVADLIKENNKAPIAKQMSNEELDQDLIDIFKNGKPLPGATKIFDKGDMKAYMVTGTTKENRNALYTMSGKHWRAIEKKGGDPEKVARTFNECTWCTASEDKNSEYLEAGAKLIMFYGSDGFPLYELTRITDSQEPNYEFHDAKNHDVPLKELTQLIRQYGLSEEERAEMWDVLRVKPNIANHIIDNPDMHPNSK